MKTFRCRKPENGFSMLELVVVIALIGILLVVALWKLSGYVREAERVAVLTLEGQMRNALVMEMAKRILNPEGPAVLALEYSNPMDLMLEAPVNYLGRLDAAAAEDVPGRHWYFDTQGRELVYRSGGSLDDTGGAGREIHYVVRVAYSDLDGDDDYAPARDRLLGVRLQRRGGSGWLGGKKLQAPDRSAVSGS